MGLKQVNPGISRGKTFKIVRNLIIGGTIIAIIGTVTYHLGKNSGNNEEQSTSIGATMPDVTNGNDFIDDATMDSSTKLENDNEELKSIIDQILKVEFQPTDTYFQNYDIKSSVSDELNALNNANASETNSEETSYDWYQNGIIDSDKLYEKIIANSKASGIEITTNVEEITKDITKEIQGCLDYVKQKAPNYDSKASLKNIDTLKIDDVADEDYMSNYDSKKNLIEIDVQYTQEKNLFEYNIPYALFKALVKQGDEVYWNFISQRFNEDLIMDYENRNIDNYKDEGYKVEMLAAATGKSYEEFNKYYLESDINSIIGAFEPEMPKEYVLSILKALDIACGYGDIPAGCDETKFRNNASAYAKAGLLDTCYIMKMKEVYKDGKSIDDAQNEIIEVTKKVLNDKYSPLSMDDQTKAELDKCSDQLNKISYGVKYSKK